MSSPPAAKRPKHAAAPPWSQDGPTSGNTEEHQFKPLGAFLHVRDLQALQYVGVPMYVFDAVRLRITWLNRPAMQFWGGTSMEEVMGRRFDDISPATRTGLALARQRILSGFEPAAGFWTFYIGGVVKRAHFRYVAAVFCDGNSSISGGDGRIGDNGEISNHDDDEDEVDGSGSAANNGVGIDIGDDSAPTGMLVQVDSIENVGEQAEPERQQLRGNEALRHASVAVLLLRPDDGLVLLQNPAAVRCFGELQSDGLSSSAAADAESTESAAPAAAATAVATALKTAEKEKSGTPAAGQAADASEAAMDALREASHATESAAVDDDTDTAAAKRTLSQRPPAFSSLFCAPGVYDEFLSAVRAEHVTRIVQIMAFEDPLFSKVSSASSTSQTDGQAAYSDFTQHETTHFTQHGQKGNVYSLPPSSARRAAWFSLRGALVFDPATGQRIVSISASDVTEVIAAKRAVVAEQFLLNMSHELRTPIAGVIGCLDLLRDDSAGVTLAPSQLASLRTARESAEGILRVVNDILDFTRSARGKTRLDRRRFNVERWLESALALLRVNDKVRNGIVPILTAVFTGNGGDDGLVNEMSLSPGVRDFDDREASTSSIESGTKFPQCNAPPAPQGLRQCPVPDILIGDEFRLRQILLNLVGNALKFTQEGYISVVLAAYEEVCDTSKQEQAVCGENEIDASFASPADSSPKTGSIPVRRKRRSTDSSSEKLMNLDDRELPGDQPELESLGQQTQCQSKCALSSPPKLLELLRQNAMTESLGHGHNQLARRTDNSDDSLVDGGFVQLFRQANHLSANTDNDSCPSHAKSISQQKSGNLANDTSATMDQQSEGARNVFGESAFQRAHASAEESLGATRRILLLLTVEDTGIGIRPESIETIWEPFDQADASTTRQYGGSGLGLPIVRELCRLMHGSVSVRSEVGSGSVFSVVVQLEVPSDINHQINEDASTAMPVSASSSSHADSAVHVALPVSKSTPAALNAEAISNDQASKDSRSSQCSSEHDNSGSVGQADSTLDLRVHARRRASAAAVVEIASSRVRPKLEISGAACRSDSPVSAFSMAGEDESGSSLGASIVTMAGRGQDAFFASTGDLRSDWSSYTSPADSLRAQNLVAAASAPAQNKFVGGWRASRSKPGSITASSGSGSSGRVERSLEDAAGFASTHRERLRQGDHSHDVGDMERVLAPDPPSMQILLVDDNPVNVAILRQMLSAVGMLVQTACDGFEAVLQFDRGAAFPYILESTFDNTSTDDMRFVKSHGFDVVFMDVSMPRMSGPDAARAIRTIERYASMKRVYIVGCTAHDGDMSALFAECGIDDFVGKPVRKDVLRTVLWRAHRFLHA